jgi:hypothetical protein
VATEIIHSPLMMFPNELFFDVASHFESFSDLNSFLRTNHFFHTLLNAHLYRRAVRANDTVREAILTWLRY